MVPYDFIGVARSTLVQLMFCPLFGASYLMHCKVCIEPFEANINEYIDPVK